jgi:hypothetical protein
MHHFFLLKVLAAIALAAALLLAHRSDRGVIIDAHHPVARPIGTFNGVGH